jgi:CRP-like cAMP-binding protein
VLTPKDFQTQFKRLLLTPIPGMAWEDKLARIQQCLREVGKGSEQESAELPPSLAIIPFSPGCRPLDEALNPGAGVSERIGYLGSAVSGGGSDDVWVLYRVNDLQGLTASLDTPIEVRMSASFLRPGPGGQVAYPVPGLSQVSVPPQVVSAASYPVPALEPASWDTFHQSTYVVSLSPEHLVPRAEADFADGQAGYRWEEADPALREATPDGADPFTFANLFHQKLRLDLDLLTDGKKLSSEAIDIEVYDTRRFGSLYARLVDRLVKADTERQAQTLGISELHEGYHPWFPALVICADKANLYLRAIHDDLQQHRRNLPDPGWLLRVGLYLELLTCLGICEAVKDQVPDLLTPAERRAFEQSPLFEEVRRRINVEAWKAAWALRDIAPRSEGQLATGPVSVTNLLRKQEATLAFLRAHHEDLKHAIDLSGANLNSAQETWHRVFRDAERAVFKNSFAPFPELGHLEPRYREFVLWHRKGDVRAFGLKALPEALTSAFRDGDGLFLSACVEVRRLMNDVARWAQGRGLMDYAGEECVPRNASLLVPYMSGNAVLLSALQRRDGYGPGLDVETKFTAAEPGAVGSTVSVADVADLLRKVPVLKPLTDREVQKLAARARRVGFGPLDRIVTQGEGGSSLFLVESGSVEVLVRQEDGHETSVATLESGAVFGEFALLTGEERTATVRAVEQVYLFEITKEALQPVIEARPHLVTELSLLMVLRQVETRERISQVNEDRSRDLALRIRQFVLGLGGA